MPSQFLINDDIEKTLATNNVIAQKAAFWNIRHVGTAGSSS